MPLVPSQECVEAAQLGDEDAIRVLYRWLNPGLLRYLDHHPGGEAEDLAADVWLALARGLRSFEGGVADLRALAFAIARRRVVDHHRRGSRRVSVVPLDDFADPDSRERTDELVDDRLAVRRAVDALVGSLPPEQAEIVLLRVLGDLDVAAVAAILGKTPAAVRAAQCRAMRTIHAAYERKSVTR